MDQIQNMKMHETAKLNSRRLLKVIYCPLVVATLTLQLVQGSPASVSQLQPIPDATGFAGMFAGVLGGKLWAGGGSQWDKPHWLNGRKRFSDRIYVLDNPDGNWTAVSDRLPQPAGHFATATDEGRVFVLGGVSSEGCLSASFVGTLENGRLRWLPLPDLPSSVGYGAAAVVAGRVYVIGGLRHPSDRAAQAEVWSLPVTPAPAAREGWRREPDLPSGGVFIAAAGGLGAELFVVGGLGIDASGNYLPRDTLGIFSVTTRTWRSGASLPEPRAGAATPCFSEDARRFFLIGGYASIFSGESRDHPPFAAQTYVYGVAEDRWYNGPELPVTPVSDRDAAGDRGPSPMIAAPAVSWHGQAVVVSGEVRDGVRSPQVLSLSLNRF